MGKRNVAFPVLGFLCVMLSGGCGTGEKPPPSPIILEGEYVPEGVENIVFTFSKDSTLHVTQTGIYEFARDGEGRDILRLCFDDTGRELPEDYSYTNYFVEEDRRYVYLTVAAEHVEEEPSPMMLKLLGGTDGLPKGKLFSGTYQIGVEGNNYQYVFSEDGTVIMEIHEYYYMEEEKLTLSDASGSTDYKYELTEGQIKINNLLGETVLSLQKEGQMR